MKRNTPQELVLQHMSRVFQRFRRGGDQSPITDRGEWDSIVDLSSPHEREILKELVRFADFWRYLQSRKERLGSATVDAISSLRNLPVPDRIARLKEINQKLMDRIDAGQGARFRN